jgi:hypothetical protein
MQRTPMTFRRARALLAVAMAWLVGSSVAAMAEDRPESETTTATISGVVTDTTGAPMPGATIVVTSEALAGEEAAITDAAGVYAITGLPPGTYLVTVYYADGTWSRNAVSATMGESVDVSFTIDISESYGEVITISESSPTIDTTGDSHGVSFSGSTSLDISYTMNLPVPGRSFTSALGSAPGTSGSGQTPEPSAGLLTAATVGDADRFGEYIDFIDRHDDERKELGIAPDRRVRIRVVDSSQTTVNNAAIFVADDQSVQGRTHADGVWDYIPGDNESGTVHVTVEADGARADRTIRIPRHGRTDEILVELPDPVGGLPDALDLAFAIDATGSMGDEMDYLTAELRDIVAAIRDAVPGVSIRVGAVIYRDRQDTTPLSRRDFSTDVDAFVDWLATLHAEGGGDTPEDMNRGLHEAMTELEWREGNVARTLVVLADAPPKVYDDAQYRYTDAMRDASSRGIRLLPVAASSSDRTVEYLFRAMGVYTSTPYVYLTDHSGIGNDHLEADTDEVIVEQFNALLFRLVVADLRGEGMHAPGDWQSWGDYREAPWERSERKLVVGAALGGGFMFDDTLAHVSWARAGVAFGDLELRAQLGWSRDLEVTPASSLKSGGTPMAPMDVDMMLAGASLRYLFGDWNNVRAFTSAGLEALRVRSDLVTDTTHIFMSQLGAEWRASTSGLAVGVQATSHLLLDTASKAADVAPLPPLELSLYADYRF